MTASKEKITIRKVDSVSSFVKMVLEMKSKDGDLPVAFRGQKYEKWLTIPKIFRPDVGLYDHEKNAVRDLISVHPQEFRHDETMFDRLVRMQHFNLPTRLLDVTTNPLVALFFASEDHEKDGVPKDGKVQALFMPGDRQRYFDSDRVSCLANIANLTAEEKTKIFDSLSLPRADFNEVDAVQRLLWFVRIEKPHFEPKINPDDIRMPVYVKPKMNNRRIIAQSGSFIVFGLLNKDWRRHEKDPSRNDEGIRFAHIIVPAQHKPEIRRQLDRLGIHASALFPEIDRAADHIVQRYARSEP